jgi:hypothetical protein
MRTLLDRAETPAVSRRSHNDDFYLNANGLMSHLPGKRIALRAIRLAATLLAGAVGTCVSVNQREHDGLAV